MHIGIKGRAKMLKRKIQFRDLDKDIIISVPRKVNKYRKGGYLMLNQDKILAIPHLGA